MAFGRSSSTGRARAPRGERRAPPPLDAAALDGLAVRYVGRFATTQGKLAAYLRRKLRERGADDVGEADVERVVARCVAAGYVDDDAFAQQRAASLGRRGYGHRRVAMALGAAGIEPAVVASLAPDDDAAIAAAERFAMRRRIGRFGTKAPDQGERNRQYAAMMRAGHASAIALRLINEAVGEHEIDGDQ